MISELTILVVVHGLSILCGVFVGYKIALRCMDLDLKYDNDIDLPSFEPEDIAEPLLSKIFPDKFKKDKEDKFISPEDLIDNEKRHAFYD
jgi:hypothetical protein